MILSHEIGVRERISPVSGLYRKYLTIRAHGMTIRTQGKKWQNCSLECFTASTIPANGLDRRHSDVCRSVPHDRAGLRSRRRKSSSSWPVSLFSASFAPNLFPNNGRSLMAPAPSTRSNVPTAPAASFLSLMLPLLSPHIVPPPYLGHGVQTKWHARPGREYTIICNLVNSAKFSTILCDNLVHLDPLPSSWKQIWLNFRFVCSFQAV